MRTAYLFILTLANVALLVVALLILIRYLTGDYCRPIPARVVIGL